MDEPRAPTVEATDEDLDQLADALVALALNAYRLKVASHTGARDAERAPRDPGEKRPPKEHRGRAA